MRHTEYSRGAIFWAALPETRNPSCVEKGYRPVVIVSSFLGSLSSEIVMVCPMTSKLKDMSVNVVVNWSSPKGSKSQVLCNQIMTLPKYMLQNPSGRVSPEELDEINNAIIIALGIAPSYVSNLQTSQEKLINLKKDVALMKDLIPQAKDIIRQLTEVVNRAEPRRVKHRRSQEEIDDFIREWEDPYNNKKEVAEAYNFSSVTTARQFYNRRVK